ncbi:MAG TPA: redoxin domain-containing protein [Blastocatellia bacterium]|nr:redoxin domain-containing protein [Blastocatellia bacterium]
MRREGVSCATVLLILAVTAGAQAGPQTGGSSQRPAERPAVEYVQEVTQLLREANRADLSEQETKAARARAQQQALQYASVVKARQPRGLEKFYLGYLYALADRADEALMLFRDVVADDSVVPEERERVRLNVIEKLCQAGRLKDAELEAAAISDRAFNAEEVRAGAYHLLAIAATTAGQVDAAVAYEERSLEAARKSGIIPLISRSAWALAQLYVAVGRIPDAARMLSEVKAEFERQSVVGGDAAQTLQKSASYIKSALAQLEMLGKPAPEIVTVKWLEEEPTTLARLKGKVVALEFWAAWCPDCRGMIPHLREWAARYQKDGLKILTVTRYYGFNGREVGRATREEEETFLIHFKRLRQLPYGTAIDDGQRSFDLYSVTWVPTIAIIDRAGRVRFVFTWHENPALCEMMIKKILAEPAPSNS